MLNHFANFFYMGGYAAYVWPAYGVTLSILFYNIFTALKNKQKILNKLSEYYQEENNEGSS